MSTYGETNFLKIAKKIKENERRSWKGAQIAARRRLGQRGGNGEPAHAFAKGCAKGKMQSIKLGVTARTYGLIAHLQTMVDKIKEFKMGEKFETPLQNMITKIKEFENEYCEAHYKTNGSLEKTYSAKIKQMNDQIDAFDFKNADFINSMKDQIDAYGSTKFDSKQYANDLFSVRRNLDTLIDTLRLILKKIEG